MFRLVSLVLMLVCTGSFAQPSTHVFTDASWIGPGFKEDSIKRPCLIFNKEFTAGKKIKEAKLFITVHGLYEATINGKRIGNAYFTPGWTSYDHRLEYQEYDVSKQLRNGNNEIRVTVGEGWWRGVFGHFNQTNNYGNDGSLLCAIYIQFADGSRVQIVSDSSWQAATGPILYSDLYNGEVFDAGISPARWSPVVLKKHRKNDLDLSVSPPVTKHEVFRPKKIFITPKGEQVIDFGQNMTGWVRVSVNGNAGDTVKIAHAELLDKKGNFYTGNLRDAKATDIYILNGKGTEIFEPHFTFHGFRYVKVEGCDISKASFYAISLYSDLPQSGSFECSDPLINQLQSNIEWSLKSNFFDIPMDCPQRSERLGWTGDAQVFCQTAAYNHNMNRFFRKWLKDLRLDQGKNGAVPNIIPDLYGHRNTGPKKGVAGWGDAATIIPWTMYAMYADTAILREQYTSMKAWVDYIYDHSHNGLWKATGYGDWMAPGDSTSVPFIDQCFWAHSTQLLIDAAVVIGRSDDVEKYTDMLSTIKNAFLSNYIDENAKAITHTQTAYVLALQFDMLPNSLQQKAVQHLLQLISDNKHHLATGFLGTPYLLHVLSKYGHADMAYTLLEQKTCPSWLYPVTKGATTIWEKWDAIRPDGTVQRVSFNHYAYGAVGDWLYRVVGGIVPLAPGFRKVTIAPQPGGSLQWAKASYRSSYGTIESGWTRKGKRISYRIVIPAGISAELALPGEPVKEIGGGRYRFTRSLP